MEDKTCVITILNVHGRELDSDATNAAMTVCAQHLHSAKAIDIYPEERVPLDAPAYKYPGWLEWIIRVHYHDISILTIGLVQREPGAEFETHT